VSLTSLYMAVMMSPKAKSLFSRLSAHELDDVSTIKEFLLREFKLTPRARFNAATRAHDETHTLFVSRLKNLFPFYVRSRECDSHDKQVDLVVADRLQDTLSGPCLNYCLSIAGQTGSPQFAASEIAADVIAAKNQPPMQRAENLNRRLTFFVSPPRIYADL